MAFNLQNMTKGLLKACNPDPEQAGNILLAINALGMVFAALSNTYAAAVDKNTSAEDKKFVVELIAEKVTFLSSKKADEYHEDFGGFEEYFDKYVENLKPFEFWHRKHHSFSHYEKQQSNLFSHLDYSVINLIAFLSSLL